MNDTEILLCANDDNLNTTHHAAMIQEVLASCKAYGVQMKARKYSRLGYIRLDFPVSISIQINKVNEVNKFL
jgi:hypothetical protein